MLTREVPKNLTSCIKQVGCWTDDYTITNMNKKQKIIVGIALAIFALTLLCAPWTVTSSLTHISRSDVSPVWDGPSNGELQTVALLIEWVGIGVISCGLLAIFREKR